MQCRKPWRCSRYEHTRYVQMSNFHHYNFDLCVYSPNVRNKLRYNKQPNYVNEFRLRRFLSRVRIIYVNTVQLNDCRWKFDASAFDLRFTRKYHVKN